MPRSISVANQAALQARALVARDFLWIVARNRSTGLPQSVGFWSDVGNVSASVIDPDNGNAEARAFYGSGGLIQISDIPLVANITVQTVTIVMSQIDELVAQAVRLYDCKQARVEIFRGLFDPSTRQMVAAAECRFVGFVDTIEIKTPAENEEGAVTLICTSSTQEMTRSNPDTRSHESQIKRSATDNFFQDASVVGEWEHFWGRASGKVATAAPTKPTKPAGSGGSTWGGAQ